MRSPLLIPVLLAVLLTASVAESAPPWIWDTDQNGVDDRIVAVETQGIAASYVGGDIGAQQRFDVTDLGGGVFSYGLFVKYDHPPTAADDQALSDLGLPTHAYLYIPYIRTRATFAQIASILALPGVARVEVMEIMVATNDNATQTMQAAPSNYGTFPSVSRDLGITGSGVVVAVLDTGVNDQPDSLGTYPGHESLSGKFVGGGSFFLGQSATNTALTDSENPFDGSPDFSHGSHVAGSALGSGGPVGHPTGGNYGFYRGVAPEARLVDCKVLSDAGTGLGSADGLEWVIFNKDRDWGVPGYRGIQVVNMSLGGSDPSDGTDANSAAVNAAVKAGLVVLVATGNDGNTGYMPSPAAADLAISVGATVDANTLDRLDDIVADFSNEGPRLSDGDGDSLDEMKPSICAPGGGITSVEGVRTASGVSYATTNGTSMSCPMAAGVAALIIEACPGISPAEVREILQNTADHRVTGGKQAPGTVDPFGVDPNYHPSWGWGNVAAYAAVMEARFPNRTQVIRESGGAVLGGIDVRWTTQREVDLFGFDVLRADPVYGQPGAFQAVNGAVIPPTGDAILKGDGNRTDYLYQDQDPGLVPGETYWYRVRWRDMQGRLHEEPAFPVLFDPPTPIATIEWTITHSYMDNDLLVYIGSGTDAGDPPNTAPYFFVGQGAGAADSIGSATGHPWTGVDINHFSRVLTDQDLGAAQFLPPSADNPWFLSVTEGGFVNTKGRIDDFRITMHEPGGDVVHTPLLPVFPLETVEHVTHVVWIPADPTGTANHAPVLDPIGTREVQEGGSLSFQITGNDADGDPLTYTATNLPPGATFNPGTRTFDWSPGFGAVATTTVFTVTFEVDDGSILSNNDSEDVEIRLHDVDPGANLAPFWEALADQSVVQANTLEFKVRARDPENGALTYSAAGLPAGASFDPVTRCFSWPTAPGDDGDYQVQFTVSDGVNPDVTEAVQITVKGTIPPPLGACESTVTSFPGNSAIGSADVGTADVDTIMVSFPVPVVRLVAVLGWANATTDLDYAMYDSNGNSVGGAGSLDNPETFIADNLPAGTYTFVITGFLVLAPTDWVLDVDACELSAVPVKLSHFAASAADGAVRLEWATSEEVNHAGFHIARSGHETDGFVRINPEMIQGRGVYEYMDREPVGLEAGVAYYRLEAVGRDGSVELLGPWSVDVSGIRRLGIRLAQNFPNPFGAQTNIRFHLPVASSASIDVFDIRGARVRQLVRGEFNAGDQIVVWDGLDDLGTAAASGVYFYRLDVPGHYVETRRMLLAR